MRLPSRHRIWQVAADGLLVALAWYLAFQVRFDQGVPGRYDEFLGWDVFAVVVAIELAVFVAFGLYEHWWRYVSIRDMWRAFLAVTVASIAVVVVLLWRPVDGWRVREGSWPRLALRPRLRDGRQARRADADRNGGRLASSLARQGGAHRRGRRRRPARHSRDAEEPAQLGYTPIGLIDDDARKKNMRLHGIRVLGATLELPWLLADNRPDEVIIAIPSGDSDVHQRIVNAYRTPACR